MNKTATARARIEPRLKERAEKILEECGLTASQGINLFYRQVIEHRGLPFPVRVPNAATRKALRESATGRVKKFDSAEDLFEDLGI